MIPHKSILGYSYYEYLLLIQYLNFDFFCFVKSLAANKARLVYRKIKYVYSCDPKYYHTPKGDECTDKTCRCHHQQEVDDAFAQVKELIVRGADVTKLSPRKSNIFLHFYYHLTYKFIPNQIVM